MLWYLQIHWPLPKAQFGESKVVLAHVLLKLGRGRLGLGQRHIGQFKPCLKELGAQDLTCPAGLMSPGHNIQAFSHFQVPHFQSATYFLPIILEK